MAQFTAMVLSSEGSQKVFVEAASVREAIQKLELDYGRGNVRDARLYIAEVHESPERRALDAKEISKYVREHRSPAVHQQSRMNAEESNEMWMSSFVVGWLATIVSVSVFLGRILLKWAASIFTRMPF